MKHAIDENFIPVLTSAFELDTLNEHNGTIVGLWNDKRIAYLNPAWFSFYQENAVNPNAPISQIGDCYMDSIPELLVSFHLNLFEQSSLLLGDTKIIDHCYECSSPTHFRKFSMQIFPIAYNQDSENADKSKNVAFLLLNSLLVELPIEKKYQSKKGYSIGDYRNADGIIVQCSHCRRVRPTANDTQWDWVPELVRESDPKTSHGLCEICLEYFYPENRAFG